MDSVRIDRLVIVCVAIASRTAAVLVLQSHTLPRSTYEHGEIASNLLAGKGFSIKFLGAEGPTSQQAPIYPAAVAAAYWIGGVESPKALLLLELGQGLLGGWLVLELMKLTGLMTPGRRRPEQAAGLIAALHPTLVYAATHVQVALLAATLLVAVLRRSYECANSGDWADAAKCGFFLGLLILTDPILGLVAPGVAVAILGGSRIGRAHATKLVGAAGLVAALTISPWVARNALVHKEFVFVKSTFGYAFWQGNCKLSQGTDKVVRPSTERRLAVASGNLADLNKTLWEARHEAGYLDDVALSRKYVAELGKLSEPERSRVLFRQALADLKRDPLRYPRLCLRRLRFFLLFDETNPKTRNLAYRLGHLGLTAIAVLGLVFMNPVMRRRAIPTILTVALLTVFHSMTIVSARFHIPIEPLFALWAGLGLTRFDEATGIGSTAAADDVECVGVVDAVLL